MNCSPPGSSIHGILQARILDWVAISSSRGIFPTQGLNPHLLTVDPLPLSHLGSPTLFIPHQSQESWIWCLLRCVRVYNTL